MAKTPPTFDLRALAKERLRRLNEPSPEELAIEVAEAEAEGVRLFVLPGARSLAKKMGPKTEECE